MRAMFLLFSHLAFRPAIRSDARGLTVRTSLAVQALSLLSYSRRLRIDRAARQITVRVRALWGLVTVKTFSFERVAYVDYDFAGLGPVGGSVSIGGQATTRLELFSTWLVLKDPYDKVKLFDFAGESSLVTSWDGSVHEESAVLPGFACHGRASRAFVGTLTGILGVPLGMPATHLRVPTGTAYRCGTCDRPSAPGRARCLYCGGMLAVSDEETARRPACGGRRQSVS